MKVKRKEGLETLNAISDPEVVAESCLPELRAVLRQQKLGFARATRARNITHLTLTGANQRYGFAREQYPIHLLGGSHDLYWIGVALDFRYTNPAFQLVSAAILVFRGLASGLPTPFLRAEWHCSSLDLAAPHAQPHWHAYSIERRDPLRFGADEDAVQTFGEATQQSEEMTILPFHFAMCANWQLGSKAISKSPLENASELSDWLGGCIGYINGQIA